MIYEKNATEMATALEKGEISAVELTKAHLDRIAAVDGEVKAFLYVDNEGALHQFRGSGLTSELLGRNVISHWRPEPVS